MAGSNDSWITNRVPLYIPLFLALFIINKTLEIYKIGVPWFVSGYLDDIVFMPILFWTTEKGTSLIHKKKVILSSRMIVIITIYISIMFEYLIPKWKPYFVSDYKDIIAYSIGSILFTVLRKNEKQK